MPHDRNKPPAFVALYRLADSRGSRSTLAGKSNKKGRLSWSLFGSHQTSGTPLSLSFLGMKESLPPFVLSHRETDRLARAAIESGWTKIVRVDYGPTCELGRPEPQITVLSDANLVYLLRSVLTLYEATDGSREGGEKTLSGADLVERLGWIAPEIEKKLKQVEAADEMEMSCSLILSTRHLPDIKNGPQATIDDSDHGCAPMTEETMYGWRLYVGCDEPPASDYGKLCQAVAAARALGCMWIDFDRDGGEYPSLPRWDDSGEAIQ